MSELGPKERVWSIAFSKLCLDFSADLSFRRAACLLNTVFHRPTEDALKVRTLADFVERTGTGIQGYLLAVSSAVLEDGRFETKAAQTEGAAEAAEAFGTENGPALSAEQKLWEDKVAEKVAEINAQRKPSEQIGRLEDLPKMESSKDRCCYISIDDIGVKHQKETRAGNNTRSAKYVENTVVHIQSGEGSYCLTAPSMDSAFQILVAFLLSNGLMRKDSLVFLADGARDIKCHIEKYFSFRPYVLILDWYHLKKKCKELISSSVKGTIEEKRGHVQDLLRMLWVGNVKGALSYLEALDGSQVKSAYWLGELTGYLQRKEGQIACYALRHELGFRVSSNRVEKANDLLVAQRQKHNGMSWSFEGSSSLASITMVMQNGEMDQWLRTRSLPFSMPEKVAA